MPTLPHARLIRAVALVVLGVAIAGSRPVVAQVVESVAAADSDLELMERADSGTYRTYSIKLSGRDNNFVLATNKDGVAAEVQVDGIEGLTLWRDLLKTGLEMMGDAIPEKAFPDQSHFTVKYRVGQTTGGFSVYGVDSVSDERYRKVVEAILELADRHVPESVR